MEDIIFTEEFLAVIVSMVVFILLFVFGIRVEDTKVRQWILDIYNTLTKKNKE